MITREDLSRDDLYNRVKVVLSVNACGEALRNQSISSRPLGTVARQNGGQLPRESGQEALEDVAPALERLLDFEPADGQEQPDYLLGHRTLALANSFLEKGNLSVAKNLAYEVALRFVGGDLSVPGASDSGVFTPIYRDLGDKKQIILLYGFRLLISSSALSHDWFQALSWFEELQALSTNIWMLQNTIGMQEWERYGTMNSFWTSYLSEGITIAGKILNMLQNTGTYHYLTVVADRYTRSLPSGEFKDLCITSFPVGLLEEGGQESEALLQIRHPDPKTTFKYVLVDARLQVSGAWKRLSVKPNEIMGRRTSSNAFIWKGYLYIAGGSTMGDKEARKYKHPQDVWRLQLDPLGDWQLFSKLPLSTSHRYFDQLGPMNIRVYKDKGYLFTGHRTLDVLDLKTGKWSKFQTTYRPTAADRAAGIDSEWPFSFSGKCNVPLAGAALQIIKDRLLVFGGIHVKSLLGCNLFMELNLKTKRWRRLGGYTNVQQKNDPNLPGPRYSAASWADNGKFFILYGICEKVKPGYALNNDIGPTEQWVWDDMWSWDVDQEKWRRERIAGNPPAPRYEMGYAYNEKLNKVIVFGGVNSRCHHRIKGANGFFDSAIYADTFMLSTVSDTAEASTDISEDGCQQGAYRWKQVMTCGFPTYRAGCSLVCDPDTGKIYMYGGRVRGEFVPNRNHTESQAAKLGRVQTLRARAERPVLPNFPVELTEIGMSRHFGHVWQLHIDIPGGHFESIDQEDEMRTAPPGPWDRCFECGEAGFWKQCGGSCGGRAHFCSRECQVKGWKLHKKMHSCMKLT